MSIAIGYSRITGIHNTLVSSHLDLFPSTVPSHSMGGVKKIEIGGITNSQTMAALAKRWEMFLQIYQGPFKRVLFNLVYHLSFNWYGTKPSPNPLPLGSSKSQNAEDKKIKEVG